MSTQILGVRDMARMIRDAVVDHFEDVGIEVPGRVAIVPGNPDAVAWDCEQLLVALQGVGWGQAEDAAVASPQNNAMLSVMAIRHAIFIIELVRCTPSGTELQPLPTTDDLNAAGEQFMRDAGALSQALVKACQTISAQLDKTGLVQPGLISPAGPEGGFHGIYGSIAVTVGQLEA